jgi:hypothetical protein
MSNTKINAVINATAAPSISVNLGNYEFDDQAEIGPVTATMTFVNNGTLTGSFFTNGAAPANQWLNTPDLVTAALYEMKVSLVSGAVPSTGTMDTWLGNGTNRTWTNVRSTFGGRTSVLLVKIRLISSGVEVASVTMTLSARVQSLENSDL